MKKINTVQKHAVLKEKLLHLLLRQFINNLKKPRKNIIRKLILLRKRFFAHKVYILHYRSLILKLKERFRRFTDNNFGLNMWNNTNVLAIRQQFRADFRMTLDIFMDIVTLVRNRLKKQDTQFREAVPVEKRVVIAFRSSH